MKQYRSRPVRREDWWTVADDDDVTKAWKAAGFPSRTAFVRAKVMASVRRILNKTSSGSDHRNH